MSTAVTTGPRKAQRRALTGWLALVLTGLSLVWLAVRAGASPGTAPAPFRGSYAVDVTGWLPLPPLVAAGVIAAARRGVADRAPWAAVLAGSGLAALAWTLALAAARGTAPGSAVTAWIAALAWAVTVPLVVAAVRGVCGDLPGRRYAPVVALAPYALWVCDTAPHDSTQHNAGGAVAGHAVVALLAAAALAAGTYASDHRRRGGPAAASAVTAGLFLGTATAMAYEVAWLGLAVGCLYFARRRAALNLLTAGAALLAGFGGQRLGLVGPAPAEAAGPALLWLGLDAVVLLLVAGPPLVASLRRVRNTPGWPFLVGAGAAVLFTAGAGLARGGAEQSWLAFLPWLTVAAVAPARQAGGPPPAPLLLVAAGTLTATTLAAILRP